MSRHEPVHLPEPPQPLSVPEAGQWLATTAGRLAGNGYSWLQAVHWVAETECYRPSRRHGPQFGPTTVRVARMLSALSPCRPGVAYVGRELKLSERSVKYHLGMLREAGLLAYITRGSRAQGRVALASEFALVIPPQFDEALGVRTAGEGVQRRPVGIADDNRRHITALGRLAAARPGGRSGPGRGSGRTRRRSGSRINCADRQPCCTPMENTSVGGSPTVVTWFPPDGPLTGEPAHDTQPGGGRRSDGGKACAQAAGARPNPLARRFRLAKRLIEEIPWLGRAALPRIAWVAREVADAGWDVTEVVAWLGLSAPPDRVRRPSAFLAHRLKGAHLVAVTPAQRANLVEEWRDNCRGPASGRQEWEGRWQPPVSCAVRAAVATALAAPTAWHTHDAAKADEAAAGPGPEEDLSPSDEEIAHLRAAALRDPSLVRAALDTCGADFAARIYSPRLVGLVRGVQNGGGARLRLHAADGRPEFP